MESDVVQSFNKALFSMYDSKPPVSKQKIFDITKAAMNAIRYFKHVVFCIEKFLVKCRSEYKIAGLYVIDSIVRQARKQYQHKDVFAPRFAINLQNTFANILSCDVNERLKAVRVLNLWMANKIFEEDVIEPLLQHCRALGLEVDTEKIEMIVKGEKANMQIYGAEAPTAAPDKRSKVKKSQSSFAPKTPPLELRPKTPEDTSFEMENSTNGSLNDRDILSLLENNDYQLPKLIGDDKELLNKVVKMVNDRLIEKLEIERRRRGNLKNLLSREFDYSDEEDEDDRQKGGENSLLGLSKDHIMAAAKSLFHEGSLNQDLLQLQQEIVRQKAENQLHAIQLPPPHMQFPVNFPAPQFSFPPPNGKAFFTPMASTVPVPHQNDYVTPSSSSASEIKIERDKAHDRDVDRGGSSRKRGRSSRSRSIDRSASKRDPRRERERSSGRDRSHSDRKQQRRSRSPTSNSRRDRDYRDRRSSRDKEKERGGGSGRAKDEEKEEKDRERERKKNGLPTHPKDGYVLIASRTLWFGRIPQNCSESDICEAVKEAGVPEKVNIVAPRGCAYVTMKERRAAFKIMDRTRDILVQKKSVKLSWATIQGLKEDERLMDYWDSARGIAQIPFNKLPNVLDPLLSGAHLDVDTLPSHLKGLYTSKGLKSSVQEQDHQQQNAPTLLSDMLAMSMPSGAGVVAPPVNSSSGGPPAVFQSSSLPHGNPLFSFQQQLNMPSFMPGASALIAKADVQQPQQQPSTQVNASIPGGVAAFPFPPPGAAGIQSPFGQFPNTSAAAAAFLNTTAPPPQFHQLPLGTASAAALQAGKVDPQMLVNLSNRLSHNGQPVFPPSNTLNNASTAAGMIARGRGFQGRGNFNTNPRGGGRFNRGGFGRGGMRGVSDGGSSFNTDGPNNFNSGRGRFNFPHRGSFQRGGFQNNQQQQYQFPPPGSGNDGPRTDFPPRFNNESRDSAGGLRLNNYNNETDDGGHFKPYGFGQSQRPAGQTLIPLGGHHDANDRSAMDQRVHGNSDTNGGDDNHQPSVAAFGGARPRTPPPEAEPSHRSPSPMVQDSPIEDIDYYDESDEDGNDGGEGLITTNIPFDPKANITPTEEVGPPGTSPSRASKNDEIPNVNLSGLSSFKLPSLSAATLSNLRGIIASSSSGASSASEHSSSPLAIGGEKGVNSEDAHAQSESTDKPEENSKYGFVSTTNSHNASEFEKQHSSNNDNEDEAQCAPVAGKCQEENQQLGNVVDEEVSSTTFYEDSSVPVVLSEPAQTIQPLLSANFGKAEVGDDEEDEHVDVENDSENQ